MMQSGWRKEQQIGHGWLQVQLPQRCPPVACAAATGVQVLSPVGTTPVNSSCYPNTHAQQD